MPLLIETRGPSYATESRARRKFSLLAQAASATKRVERGAVIHYSRTSPAITARLRRARGNFGESFHCARPYGGVVRWCCAGKSHFNTPGSHADVCGSVESKEGSSGGSEAALPGVHEPVYEGVGVTAKRRCSACAVARQLKPLPLRPRS